MNKFSKSISPPLRALHIALGLAVGLLAGCGSSISTNTAVVGPSPNKLSTGCGDVIDENLFADAAELRRLQSIVTGFGLRSPGSAADENNISWAESQLRAMPGMVVRSDYFPLQRWQPTPSSPTGPGRSLELAGRLTVTPNGGAVRSLPIAGGVPFSLPTGSAGRSGTLVYLPAETAITAGNARNKIIIRDYPNAAIPYVGFAALAYYVTPDIIPLLTGSYDRPYLAALVQNAELIAAGSAGAAGVIWVFNVPREQVAGYWDPHNGTHYTVPSVHVGVDEGETLKQLASSGATANVAVFAERDAAMGRNLIATLPGQSAERIILNTNTDGNTWVQENSVAGLLSLADYLSRRPLECRPRTIELVFAGSHLSVATDGTAYYAQQLDQEYDNGTVAFAFSIEHLGTREILPVARTDGPGQRLEYTGMGEATGWFAGESPPLSAAAIEAIQRRGLDRTAVLRGQDVPNTSPHVPVHCSFGGIGSGFQEYLIPTLAIISGPWSLWAPSFGEGAVDFERMRKQLLAAGDVILALDDVPREVIAGPYLLERQLRALGAPTCSHVLPPEQAPGPSGS